MPAVRREPFPTTFQREWNRLPIAEECAGAAPCALRTPNQRVRSHLERKDVQSNESSLRFVVLSEENCLRRLQSCYVERSMCDGGNRRLGNDDGGPRSVLPVEVRLDLTVRLEAVS